MSDAERVDCLVVGAGPAGLTAAMYLRRFHRHVALVDDGASRAMRIDRSSNIPGFPYGISGESLLERLREQLRHAGGEVTRGRVESLVRTGDEGFVAETSVGVVRARSVVLATGVVDREPEIDGLDEVRRRGRLRYCPICDGHEWTGRRIGVIGEGDHVQREARFIRRYTPEVVVVDPSALRVEWRGDAGLRVHCAGSPPADVDVLYAALGTIARSQLAERLGAALDDAGALLVDAHGRTAVDGLLAAGDVVSALDQVAVATGHGAIVATAVHNRLRARD